MANGLVKLHIPANLKQAATNDQVIQPTASGNSIHHDRQISITNYNTEPVQKIQPSGPDSGRKTNLTGGGYKDASRISSKKSLSCSQAQDGLRPQRNQPRESFSNIGSHRTHAVEGKVDTQHTLILRTIVSPKEAPGPTADKRPTLISPS